MCGPDSNRVDGYWEPGHKIVIQIGPKSHLKVTKKNHETIIEILNLENSNSRSLAGNLVRV